MDNELQKAAHDTLADELSDRPKGEHSLHMHIRPATSPEGEKHFIIEHHHHMDGKPTGQRSEHVAKHVDELVDHILDHASEPNDGEEDVRSGKYTEGAGDAAPAEKPSGEHTAAPRHGKITIKE